MAQIFIFRIGSYPEALNSDEFVYKYLSTFHLGIPNLRALKK
jgi:hypothetical protein